MSSDEEDSEAAMPSCELAIGRSLLWIFCVFVLGKSVENDTWVNAHAMEGKIVAIYMNGETFKDDELEFVVATEECRARGWTTAAQLRKEINKWGNNLKRKIVAAYRMGNALEDETLVKLMKKDPCIKAWRWDGGPSKLRDGPKYDCAVVIDDAVLFEQPVRLDNSDSAATGHRCSRVWKLNHTLVAKGGHRVAWELQGPVEKELTRAIAARIVKHSVPVVSPENSGAEEDDAVDADDVYGDDRIVAEKRRELLKYLDEVGVHPARARRVGVKRVKAGSVKCEYYPHGWLGPCTTGFMATAAALGVRQPRDKKFEKIVLEELPPDFLQDVLDPKASWTDDVLADEEEIITKHMCAGAMFTGRAAVRGMRARAVLCVDDDKDACAIAEANKTDGDGLVVLNEKIKDEAHATRLLAEEYGGPADAILAEVTCALSINDKRKNRGENCETARFTRELYAAALAAKPGMICAENRPASFNMKVCVTGVQNATAFTVCS